MDPKPQVVVSNQLEITGLTLDPVTGGPFVIDPDVRRVLAFMFAFGPYTPGTATPLKCTLDGALYTYDGSLQLALGDAGLDGALWEGGLSAAEILTLLAADLATRLGNLETNVGYMYTILSDVYNACAHTFDVTVIP